MSHDQKNRIDQTRLETMCRVWVLHANLLIGILHEIDHMCGDLLAVIEHPRDLVRHCLGNGLKNAIPDLRCERGSHSEVSIRGHARGSSLINNL